MRKALAVAAVAAAFTVAGCSALGRQAFQQPVVKVQDVKLTGLGLTGGSIDVLVNVDNPNEFRLDATRLTYNVLLDTVPFATGTVDSKFTVEGKGMQSVRIPVNFTYAGVGEAGRQLLNTGAINYRVTGDVIVGTPIGNFTVPYSSTGRFTTLGSSR